MKHSRKSSSVTTTTLPNSWKTSVQSKSLLIAIAAFALTTNGAQAYSGQVLERAGLTTTQRTAFQTARELRAHGDNEKARDVLVNAGIDTAVIERVRSVATSGSEKLKNHSQSLTTRAARHVQMRTELSASEQEAYRVAAAANDRDAMEAILEEAGIGVGRGHHGQRYLRDGRELQ